MNWFNNLKIKSKLLLSFGFVVVLVIGLVLYVVTEMNDLSSSYRHVLNGPSIARQSMMEVQSNVRAMRRVAASLAMYSSTSNTGVINNLLSEGEGFFSFAIAALDTYDTVIMNDPYFTQAEKDYRLNLSRQTRELVNFYQTDVLLATHRLALAGDFNGALSAIESSANQINQLVVNTTYLVQTAERRMQTYVTAVERESDIAIMVTVAVGVIVAIVAITFAFVVSRVIAKPIVGLVYTVNNVANGNLNVNIDKRSFTKDEVGVLTSDISQLVETVKGINEELTVFCKNTITDYTYRMNADRFEGTYKELIVGVHAALESAEEESWLMIEALENIGKGNFTFQIKKLPGNRAIVNDAIDKVTEQLQNVMVEVDAMIDAAAEKGDLAFHVKTKGFEGDWLKVLNGLNHIAEAVDLPIVEIRDVMNVLAKGDFSKKVTGNYNGDFDMIKNSVNGMIATLESYVEEISRNLSAVAGGDLTTTITREYVGNFSTIKDSINNIGATLKRNLEEITMASKNVLEGASKITSNAMELADGSSTQAASLEELNTSVELINRQTREFAQNASEANILSNESTTNAQEGNNSMKQMLDAMVKIKESSSNISGIIKTIQDIAFQTNLLALNAAVEAARAGEHGKGFAVVAEEVRNLAARSQSAASETTTLIEDSITRVESGVNVAEATSASLDTIVKTSGEVLTLINNITTAATDQADMVSQISSTLLHTATTVQNNSKFAQEAAATSEELNSQAEILQQLVAYFKT